MRWYMPVAVLVVAVLTVPAYSVVIHVPSDQPTIQAGINAASEGDTVLVAPGTYTGPDNRKLNFHGTNIVLIGEGGADFTIIDCEITVRGFRFANGEVETSVVEGFTVKNGSASGNGGGMYIDGASPTIRYCYFTANGASLNGGGIYCANGSPEITSCAFTENYGGVDGGGIYCANGSPEITSCAFTENYGQFDGGGIYCDTASPRITECQFDSNWASDYGGALFSDGGFSTIASCSFIENGAWLGGGIFCGSASSMQIEYCAFSGNQARSGGGVFSDDGSAPTVAQCTFWENSAVSFFGAMGTGGGISCGQASCPLLRQCTFFANVAEQYGSGIFCADGSYPQITSSILASGAGGGAVYCYGDAAPTLTHCCVFGNAGGDDLCGDYHDNIFVDPLFCGAEAGDFRLRSDSPCLAPNTEWGTLIGANGFGCMSPETQYLLDGAVGPEDTGAIILIDADEATNATVRVYNLSGQLVAMVLENEPVSVGMSEWSWDLTNEDGDRVASGTYFCVLEIGDDTYTRRIAVIGR